MKRFLFWMWDELSKTSNGRSLWSRPDKQGNGRSGLARASVTHD
jgi:hypothetical protein